MEMEITLEELSADPGKYVQLAGDGDIWIIEGNKKLARITATESRKMSAYKKFRRLRGMMTADTDLNAIREERLLQ